MQRAVWRNAMDILGLCIMSCLQHSFPFVAILPGAAFVPHLPQAKVEGAFSPIDGLKSFIQQVKMLQLIL